MNTGLTSTHTARRFSVLYHVFAQKQCFLSSSLSILCCLTLHYYTLLLHRFEIFSAPGTIAHGSIRLPSSRGYSLARTSTLFTHELSTNRLRESSEQVKRFFFTWKQRLSGYSAKQFSRAIVVLQALYNFLVVVIPRREASRHISSAVHRPWEG